MMAETILASWWRTRQAMRGDAASLARQRKAAWRALQPVLARTPALAGLAGRPLADFPVTEIAAMRADPGAWNSLGLDSAQLHALADDGAAGDLSAGWSTGSSGGTRGLFVTTVAERADYIGQSLARLLPLPALLRKQALALHLRAGNALYSDARRRRFAFAHFGLDEPPERAMGAIRAFDPTILIAPPHRLLAFVRAGATLPRLRHLFCGSEPVSTAERALISAHFGIRLREIYQATEGFLGATCGHGRLHLNDHALAIELEPVAGTRGFRPVITDLRRRSQPVVRLRGDDYIEVGEGQCRCGYAGRVIEPVQGRISDIWRLPAATLTPVDVIAAVESVIGACHRWQAEAGRAGIVLRVAPQCPRDHALKAAQALERLAAMPVALRADMGAWQGPKRRKVVWHHG